MATKKIPAVQRVEATRSRFRTLLAGNPNYFGNVPESKFKVVKAIASNTSYEELTGVGYNQHIRRLFATLDVKKSTGYSGDLCDDGSTEYVRFYVDFGGGWDDVGVVATDVHDIPAGKDCANRNLHPLSYSLELPYAPSRKWCSSPQLPVVRAILSWNVEPPANSPNWKPVYGNVEECHIQIDKSWWIKHFLDDLVLKAEVPPELIASAFPLVPPPDPEFPDIPDLPEPPSPQFDAMAGKPGLTLDERVALYSGPTRGKFLRADVEPARFAFAEVQALAATPEVDLAGTDKLAAALQQFDFNLDDLVAIVEDTTGNISYEELVDLGLDGNREKLVATYTVKKASGFSGNLCTAGSVEHVAFWADWNDTCDWEYLDTVQVRAYDFDDLPDGGLCYSAALPVDLDEFKRKCQDPKVARIRAVLSWNTPPSTTDPDQLPTWGNRLDAHALVPRREGSPGVMSVIGGIAVADISDTTGMASPTAKFVDTGTTVFTTNNLDVPFGGLIVVRGPAVTGKRYRVQVIDSDGDSVTLTEKIWVTPTVGFGSYHTGSVDGWFDYLSHTQNFAGILGYYRSTQNDKVTIQLEIEGDGVVDSQAVQLDNVWPDVAVSITEPGTDCGLFTSGVLMKGRAFANDDYMGSWSVVIDGGPVGFGPVTVASGNVNTAPPPGDEWTFSTKGLKQCGYVVRVHARDRAIVNSGNHQHHRSTDVGFCILQ